MLASGAVPFVTTPSMVAPSHNAASMPAAGAATASAMFQSFLSSYHSYLCGQWL